MLEIRNGDKETVVALAKGHGKLDGLFTTPDPDQICAVVGGTAYIFRTIEPENYEPAVYERVTSVVPAVAAKLLLLCTDTDIRAFAATPQWDRFHVCVDELRIESVDGNNAIVSCYESTIDARTSFSFDLLLGERVN